MGKDTKKYIAYVAATDSKHPDSPAAQTRKTQAAEEAERKKLEQEASEAAQKKVEAEKPEQEKAETERDSSVLSDSDGVGTDPLDDSRSSSPYSSTIDVDEEPDAPDSPRVADETPAAPMPQQNNSMLRALLYSGVFMLSAAGVFYIYYTTFLKSQSTSNSKFTFDGISQLMDKLFSREVSR